MAALTYAKVNKETLRFIRNTKHISLDYVERVAKFKETKLLLWEDETSAQLPTINQAKKLAQCYRVPFAGFYMNSEDINVKHLPSFYNKRTMINDTDDDSAVNLALLDLINERDFFVETMEQLKEAIPTFILQISDANNTN